jgi:hypothetical protein
MPFDREAFRRREREDEERFQRHQEERLSSGFFGLCNRAFEGNIEPLCKYLAENALSREENWNLIRLLRQLRMQGMPRKRGPRPSRIGIDKKAERHAASIVSTKREQWREAYGRERLPPDLLDHFITEAIRDAEQAYPQAGELNPNSIRDRVERPEADAEWWIPGD